MSDTTEHRGWEISTDYHEHWADDVTYDLAEDQSEGNGKVAGSLIGAFVLLVVGLYGINLWLTPPPLKVMLLPPQIIGAQTQIIQVELPALAKGWKSECVIADQSRKLLRPLWERPDACSTAAAKKRGMF